MRFSVSQGGHDPIPGGANLSQTTDIVKPYYDEPEKIPGILDITMITKKSQGILTNHTNHNRRKHMDIFIIGVLGIITIGIVWLNVWFNRL